MPLECVAFLIIHDGAVLAERRKSSKRVDPGALALPGGHIEALESRKAALARELREELGIKASEARYVCTRTHRSQEMRRLHYFAIEAWAGDIECHEAASLHWIAVDALDRLDLKVDREAIATYLGILKRRTRIARVRGALPPDRSVTPATRETIARLRANMTDAEHRLWAALRRKQAFGARFRRQYPIGRYIVDFVCLPARLVIEVDGGQHASDGPRDERRTAWLRSQGFTVIRYWNNDVLDELESVVASIQHHLGNALASPPPSPSRKGRG
ncbi:MAG: DUF559 domain-containing protein [Alphaproteobacteria bacterium]